MGRWIFFERRIRRAIRRSTTKRCGPRHRDPESYNMADPWALGAVQGTRAVYRPGEYGPSWGEPYEGLTGQCVPVAMVPEVRSSNGWTRSDSYRSRARSGPGRSSTS